MVWHRAEAHTGVFLHADSHGPMIMLLTISMHLGPALDVEGAFGAAGRPLLGGGVLGAGAASSTGCSS